MKRKKELRGLGCSDFTLTHGFFFDMGGFCLKSSGPKYHQLQVRDIEDRRAKPHSKEWIHELSNISEDRVKDSATSDNIAKSGLPASCVASNSSSVSISSSSSRCPLGSQHDGLRLMCIDLVWVLVE